MSQFIRYWHTVRWLKPVQMFGRLKFRLVRPRPDSRAAPSRRVSKGVWKACARARSLMGPATFRFQEVQRRIAGPADWDRADWPKLWRYHLHYFNDLMAQGAAGRVNRHQALIARWIDECPPAEGTGWEPYPLSLRIVNWSKWMLAAHAPVPGMLDSLAVQARYLRRRIEHHLQGNHLLANLKALVFAGTVFEGEEAEQWREYGLRLLRRELAEQVLRDGGHFERSPMYHAVVLEDVLDLIQLDERFPGVFPADLVDTWRELAPRMLRWLRVMTHPDGEIAFFNDAAMGVAPNLVALADYATRLELQLDMQPLDCIEELPDSGFVRMQGHGAMLIADVGSVAPDHLPDHAHAGTLSFELSLRGRRVLVNGGTSTYVTGPERMRQRGTASHNTVMVDDQNSSEVWAGFRVAARARTFDVQAGITGDAALHRGGGSSYGRSSGTDESRWHEPWPECAAKQVDAESGLFLEASHDGYRRLPGRVVHGRSWSLGARGLEVVDTLKGDAKSAVARFRFHPDCDASGDRVGPLRWRTSAGKATLQTSTWHPCFGASEPCLVLNVELPAEGGTTSWSWS